MNRPLFSVVMPVKIDDTPNAKQEQSDLRRAISSVMDQVETDWELIIVDDHSSYPKTLSYLEAFSGTGTEKIILEKLDKHEAGVASARNKGMSSGSGFWICFLDADDFWDMDHLSTVRSYINNTAYAKWFYSLIRTNKGQLNQPIEMGNLTELLLLGNFTCTMSSITISADTGRYLGFREDLIYAEDWDFLLEASRGGWGVCIPARTVYYDNQVGGVSDRLIDNYQKTKKMLSGHINRSIFTIDRKTADRSLENFQRWTLLDTLNKKSDRSSALKCLPVLIEAMKAGYRSFRLKLYIKLLLRILWQVIFGIQLKRIDIGELSQYRTLNED